MAECGRKLKEIKCGDGDCGICPSRKELYEVFPGLLKRTMGTLF